MARIDFFLDWNEVFAGRVVTHDGSREVPFTGSIRRANQFIEYLQGQGHKVTIVPVTSYRQELPAKDVQDIFEEGGFKAGLPFKFYTTGSRASVVQRRVAQGKTDAYVIFDDSADAYPAGQANLIAVRVRDHEDIDDDLRGISRGNIDDAKVMIAQQLQDVPAPKRPLGRLRARLGAAIEKIRY